MRFETFWRVALVQLVAVAVLALVLGVVFSHGFFVDWGWLVGPIAWLGCAALTTRIVGLDIAFAMVGAVLAGLVSALAVVIGVHWLGLVVADRPVRRLVLSRATRGNSVDLELEGVARDLNPGWESARRPL